jgi:hypothetical protein
MTGIHCRTLVSASSLHQNRHMRTVLIEIRAADLGHQHIGNSRSTFERQSLKIESYGLSRNQGSDALLLHHSRGRLGRQRMGMTGNVAACVDFGLHTR